MGQTAQWAAQQSKIEETVIEDRCGCNCNDRSPEKLIPGATLRVLIVALRIGHTKYDDDLSCGFLSSDRESAQILCVGNQEMTSR